jgi:hypothetical protein
MASGHGLCRIQRPDTWQLRPAMCKKVYKPLAKLEPSTHGSSETWGPGSHWPIAAIASSGCMAVFLVHLALEPRQVCQQLHSPE